MKKQLRLQQRIKWRWEPSIRSLRWGFSLCVFLILIVTLALFGGLEMLMDETHLLEQFGMGRPITLIVCAAASLAIGTFITYTFIKLPMKPVKKLLRGMTRLANGHFDERLDFGEAAPLREMADTFNSLAGELQNTELLRADFVNNFSHEFKTPIVSILGMAQMLQRDDLTEAQRREYVDVIVDETTRLSNMATNVLNLTKIENQSILTKTTEFNLSEQLRKSVLLLEKKWNAKELEPDMDFPEIMFRGDEALLQQVWVNLLDNAIKFSPQGAPLTVMVEEDATTVEVAIRNRGPQISPEDQKRLFDKFWQGDTSHASEGTGIGLSIVKKIIDLHGGQVSVESTEEDTAFIVTLPK